MFFIYKVLLYLIYLFFFFFFFQAEDGIRDAQESRGLGDVYKRQTNRSRLDRLLKHAVDSASPNTTLFILSFWKCSLVNWLPSEGGVVLEEASVGEALSCCCSDVDDGGVVVVCVEVVAILAASASLILFSYCRYSALNEMKS
eukprot:TRINITY_DN24500_c0_g1_i1.p2 TRINITY_DN24500_c0_g1~~TRINITY_DN24500_c0_g1_i1.p2  ORF type:complete len:143 (+),score=33.35 TRINITY_DN24500_c0_g1_i1:9-437(+)